MIYEYASVQIFKISFKKIIVHEYSSRDERALVVRHSPLPVADVAAIEALQFIAVRAFSVKSECSPLNCIANGEHTWRP